MDKAFIDHTNLTEEQWQLLMKDGNFKITPAPAPVPRVAVGSLISRVLPYRDYLHFIHGRNSVGIPFSFILALRLQANLPVFDNILGYS